MCEHEPGIIQEYDVLLDWRQAGFCGMLLPSDT